MTTPLIEAIAGSIRFTPHNAAECREVASLVLTAITETGYAVVPVKPDLDTMLGMMTAANEADEGDLTITSARAALAYLIAAQGDG